jgi:hypothetical protein
MLGAMGRNGEEFKLQRLIYWSTSGTAVERYLIEHGYNNAFKQSMGQRFY